MELCDTPVADLFILNNMVSLEAIDIKLYLYMLYLSRNGTEIDKTNIAKKLCVTEQEINFEIDGDDFLALPEVLAALADENRRKILLKLKEGKISSGDLAAALGMTPQALSYHLSKLKKADLIYETRYKNFIYYELNLSVLDEAVLWIDQLRGGPDHEEN